MPDIRVFLGDMEIHRVSFGKDVISIGRSRDNDVVIENLGVSRNHARIRKLEDGRHILSDLNSANGTQVNGLKAARVELRNGDTISIGKYRLIFNVETPLEMENADRAPEALSAPSAGGEAGARRRAYITIVKGRQQGQRFPIASGETTLGRAADNDIRVQDWFAARYHAVILTQGQDYFLRDIGSWKGTELDGEMIQEALLTNKSDIRIGSTVLRFEIEDASRPLERKVEERIQMFPESTFMLTPDGPEPQEAEAAVATTDVGDDEDTPVPDDGDNEPSTRRSPETLARDFLQSIPGIGPIAETAGAPEAEASPPPMPVREGAQVPNEAPDLSAPEPESPAETAPAMDREREEEPSQDGGVDLAEVMKDISAGEPRSAPSPISYPDSAAIEGAYVAFTHSRPRDGAEKEKRAPAGDSAEGDGDASRPTESSHRWSADALLAFLDDGPEEAPEADASPAATDRSDPSPPSDADGAAALEAMTVDELAGGLKDRLAAQMERPGAGGVEEPAPESAMESEPAPAPPSGEEAVAAEAVFEEAGATGAQSADAGADASEDTPADAGEAGAPDQALDEATRREVAIWEQALANPSAAVRREAAKKLKKLTGRDYDA